MNIYFISDTHFNHRNIIKYCDRPFNTVTEMNEHIVKTWNETIGEDDYVFFLGDFALGPKSEFDKYMCRLNGKKVFFFGNHDHIFIEQVKAYAEAVFRKPISFCYNGKEYLVSHAPKDAERNIHGHVHQHSENDKSHFNVSVEALDYKPIKIEEIERYFDVQTSI